MDAEAHRALLNDPRPQTLGHDMVDLANINAENDMPDNDQGEAGRHHANCNSAVTGRNSTVTGRNSVVTQWFQSATKRLKQGFVYTWSAFWPHLSFLWSFFYTILQLHCLWITASNGNNVTPIPTVPVPTNASWSEVYDGNSQNINGSDINDTTDDTWWWSHCHQPHKVQKVIAYSLIDCVFNLMPSILIIRWHRQVKFHDLLKKNINQAVAYDKRYLLALYVILWASTSLLNFSLKCVSCEQLFSLRWVIRFFSDNHLYDVPHIVCALSSLLFYAIIRIPQFICCCYVIDITNALVSLASETKDLSDAIITHREEQPDHVLKSISDSIDDKSWSRHSGIGEELEFFINLTMFVGATVGFSFSNIYVSSQLTTFMEWGHHVSELMQLTALGMTPFLFVAAGLNKLREAHKGFVCEARRAQVGALAKSEEMGDASGGEKWDVIIDVMKERVGSIVNTEKELLWTALATTSVILWHLLGNLNRFDDAPDTIIEDERFAVTYFIGLTLFLMIIITVGVMFPSKMVPKCVMSGHGGHKHTNLRLILYSSLVGTMILLAVSSPWFFRYYGKTCPL
ncbi:uncharacterized protein LOC144886309 [Branchiostoma floridae x Branchiostoma japonicum]